MASHVAIHNVIACKNRSKSTKAFKVNTSVSKFSFYVNLHFLCNPTEGVIKLPFIEVKVIIFSIFFPFLEFQEVLLF